MKEVRYPGIDNRKRKKYRRNLRYKNRKLIVFYVCLGLHYQNTSIFFEKEKKEKKIVVKKTKKDQLVTK